MHNCAHALYSMKKLYICTILLFVSLPFFAQRRSMSQAMNIIREQTTNSISISKSKEMNGIPDTQQINTVYAPYYFIKDSINGKTFIVSGDERMYSILGEFESVADNSELPAALLDILKLYEERYKAIDGIDKQSSMPITLEDVSPIISSVWGQGTPFNDKCPTGTPSGCVATAMAQIMNHYKYPNKGNGRFSYTTRTRWYNCSCDFSNTNFIWDNIKLDYSNEPNNTSRAAVADLLYACGVSVSMDYDKDGSGAYCVDIPFALSEYFRYNKNIICINRSYYSTSEWYSLLSKELTEGRPVIYTGVDSRTGGHAFIVDGSRSEDGKVHVNWGWNGKFDGYYHLDAMNPDKYKFSSNQNMIIHITPDDTGIREDIFYMNDFYVSSSLQMNTSCAFTLGGLLCFSNKSTYADNRNRFSGYAGLALFDSNNHFLRTLCETEIKEMNAYSTKKSITLSFTPNGEMLPDGEYLIKPYVRPLDIEIITPIRTLRGEKDSYKLTIIDGAINGGKAPQPEDNSEIVWMETFEQEALNISVFNKTVIGNSSWRERMVMMISETLPEAYNGKGYAYLDFYNTSLNGARSVNQLKTNSIFLNSNNDYTLSFAYRKYSRNMESQESITIKSSTDGLNWTDLEELSVLNTSQWLTETLDVPYSQHIYLLLEGSIGRGSSLFIDNICLRKKDKTGITTVSNRQENDVIYDFMGRKKNKDEISNSGIYIINGRKYLIK